MPPGTLATTPLADLFISMFEARRSGTLVLKSEHDGEHVVVFQGGAPVKLETTYPLADLGMVLVSLKLLTEEAYARTADAALSEREYAAELVAGGVISDSQRRVALVEQRLRALATLFRRLPDDTVADFEEHRDRSPDGQLLDVDPLRVIYRGVRGATQSPAAAETVRKAGASLLKLHPANNLDRMRLAAPDRAIVDLLAVCPRRVQDLEATNRLPPDQLAALLHFLVITRNIDSGGGALPLGVESATSNARYQYIARDVPGLGPIGPRKPDGPLAKSAAGRFAYLVFGLTLLPLVLMLFSTESDVNARIVHTLQSNPDAARLVGDRPELTMSELLHALPGGRIEGAWLSHDSWAHWGYALVAGALYIALVAWLFDRGYAKLKQLPKVALFTSTAGILFLLAVQQIAAYTEGMWIRGASVVTIFFYLLKFIGFSYRAAMDPENGFLLSFFGFTFGVGLCEELTKAVPLIWHYRRDATLDWRGASVWGLASGVGFGVAEGVMYSSDFYNGIQGGSAYVMRFVSCVALHAVWAAATAITICERQTDVQGTRHWYEYLFALVKFVFVPMILHGLYDTLLKKEMTAGALVVALASFGWLITRIERARKIEAEGSFVAPFSTV